MWCVGKGFWTHRAPLRVDLVSGTLLMVSPKKPVQKLESSGVKTKKN